MNNQEYEEVIKWFASEDTSLSSNCLIIFLATREVVKEYYPRDSEDLGRCIRALDKLPFLKKDLVKAKEISAVWGAIIEDWDLLTVLFNRGKHDAVYSVLEDSRNWKLDVNK